MRLHCQPEHVCDDICAQIVTALIHELPGRQLPGRSHTCISCYSTPPAWSCSWRCMPHDARGKEDCCKCGCRGWCSLFPVLDVIRWSLSQAAVGTNDTRRHDGSQFDPMLDARRTLPPQHTTHTTHVHPPSKHVHVHNVHVQMHLATRYTHSLREAI
jgi:hypothetical protein